MLLRHVKNSAVNILPGLTLWKISTRSHLTSTMTNQGHPMQSGHHGVSLKQPQIQIKL